MLKNLLLAISISLVAVACGGGATEEAKTGDDAAKKDAPADATKPAEGDAAKPVEGAAPPAGDAAKPVEGAPK